MLKRACVCEVKGSSEARTRKYRVGVQIREEKTGG